MRNVDLRELALKKVKITGNVIGKFGTFEIEQMYKNNTEEVLEVGYTFPIVDTATVVGFEIKVGDKILKGKCKEKGEAKREYQQNIVKGNSAYMMEQETGNIFKIYVKNKYVKWTSMVLLSLLICSIGISRIYLGVHYTSDVLGGFLISISYLVIYISAVNKFLIEK